MLCRRHTKRTCTQDENSNHASATVATKAQFNISTEREIHIHTFWSIYYFSKTRIKSWFLYVWVCDDGNDYGAAGFFFLYYHHKSYSRSAVRWFILFYLFTILIKINNKLPLPAQRGWRRIIQVRKHVVQIIGNSAQQL